MTLWFELAVTSLDSETDVFVETGDLSSLRGVLDEHEHDGSKVSLRVTADGEQVFRLIDALSPQTVAGR